MFDFCRRTISWLISLLVSFFFLVKFYFGFFCSFIFTYNFLYFFLLFLYLSIWGLFFILFYSSGIFTCLSSFFCGYFVIGGFVGGEGDALLEVEDVFGVPEVPSVTCNFFPRIVGVVLVCLVHSGFVLLLDPELLEGPGDLPPFVMVTGVFIYSFCYSVYKVIGG